MYTAIRNVKPLEGYRLLLLFANGEERVFDVSPYLNIGNYRTPRCFLIPVRNSQIRQHRMGKSFGPRPGVLA
jgi:hypothetical protein